MAKMIHDQRVLNANSGLTTTRVSSKHKNMTLKISDMLPVDLDEDKENRDLNIVSSRQPSVLGDQKYKMSKNEIKNLDLNQIKFHKTFMDQKSNILVSQICTNDDQQLHMETPSQNMNERESKSRLNLKLLKELGLQAVDNPTDENNPYKYDEKEDDNMELPRQLKRENSQKCMKNAPLNLAEAFSDKNSLKTLDVNVVEQADINSKSIPLSKTSNLTASIPKEMS